MLHKKMLACVLGALTVLSLGMTAAAQDEETLRFDFGILADGDTVESYLSLEEQTRLFAFQGFEGNEVTIEMNQIDDSGIDPYLVVLGPSGEVLAVNDDADYEDGDYNALIEDLELPETGLYFVIASSFQLITTLVDSSDLPEDELAFELTIEGLEVEEDTDATFTFHATGMGEAGVIEGEIDEDFQVTYIVFAGSEGDEVTLNADSEDFDTLIQVYDATGLRVAVNDDRDREGGDYNSTVELELPADGLYLVIVTNPYLLQSDEPIEDYSDYVGEFEFELAFD